MKALKEIDQLADVQIDESSKSNIGGILTIIAPLIVVAYAVFSYLQAPLLINTSIDTMEESVSVTLTCRCIHPRGCVYVESCSSAIDNIKFVSTGEVATVRGCRNTSNAASFTFLPRMCYLWTAENIITKFGIYSNYGQPFCNATGPDRSETTDQNGYFFGLYFQNYAGTYIEEKHYTEYDNGVKLSRCELWANGQIIATNVVKYVNVYTLIGFYQETENSIVDCGSSSKSTGGRTNSGRYTLTKTKYKESGSIEDSIKYLDVQSTYTNSMSAMYDTPLYNQAFEETCASELAIVNGKRSSTSHNLSASDSATIYASGGGRFNDLTVIFNGLYITKEVTTPWFSLLALIGGVWGSVFGAFSFIMSSSRFIKEQWTKRRQKNGRTTPQADNLYKPMESNINTLSGRKMSNNATASMYRTSQIKATAKFPEPIEDIQEPELDSFNSRSVQIRPKSFGV